MDKLVQRDNLSNDWSYLAGLRWGEIWAGVDAASYAELVDWSDPECLDRPVPLPTLARQYLPDVLQEADEHGEDFEMEAFTLGFFEVVREARGAAEAVALERGTEPEVIKRAFRSLIYKGSN